jgi:hypothetical protein
VEARQEKGTNNEREEVPIVVLADAIIEPLAMVVKMRYTFFAKTAMSTMLVHVLHTHITI